MLEKKLCFINPFVVVGDSSRISFYIPFAGLYFQPMWNFEESFLVILTPDSTIFPQFFIQIVAMETLRGKVYQSPLLNEKILEEFIEAIQTQD